jgi:PIN domain nuclease of toxin-antitoxin system
MRCLADTHALIWFFQGSRALSSVARVILDDPGARVLVSSASIYEVEYKIAIGRLQPLPASLRTLVLGAGFIFLDATAEHMEAAARLAGHHRDPWDRLIAAQARILNLPVLSRDPALAALGATVTW